MASIDVKTITIIGAILWVILGMVIYYCCWYYWFVPVKIELIEVERIYVEEELSGKWWSTAYGNVSHDYDLDLPDVDLDKYSLLYSGGREVKEFTYQRISKYKLPYGHKPYVGEAILKNELHPHTIFVYKFKKTSITYDNISWPEVKIEE